MKRKKIAKISKIFEKKETFLDCSVRCDPEKKRKILIEYYDEIIPSVYF